MNTTLLDSVMPEFQFVERHRAWVDASPEAVLAAAREVSLADMALARLLMRVRGMRTLARGPLWEQLLAGGFVALGETPGHEVLAGAIGQMWKLTGGHSPKVGNAVEFAAFNQPGYAKAAMNLSVHDVNGRCALMTETRVFATDPAARRAFSRYWLIVRPGSGIIRRVWLRAAKKRAEKPNQA
jgi:hypothetical protein